MIDRSSRPVLSVIIITYGHDKFLHKCLDSIFKQETSFPFEVIIANDNSPDNSDSIIKNFIKENSSNKISVHYHCHANNLGMTNNFIWTLGQAKGKYVAYCEGDDHWIDDFKLQKQVDFLEQNPNYSLCCGGYKTSNGEEVNCSKYNKKKNGAFSFDLNDHFSTWIIKSLTLCFRNDDDLISFLKKFKYSRDIHLFYYLLNKGKGYYFNWIFGHYNLHDGGAVSLKPKSELIEMSYIVYKDFFLNYKDPIIEKKYIGYSVLLFKMTKGYKVHFYEVLSGLIKPKYTFYILKLLLRG